MLADSCDCDFSKVLKSLCDFIEDFSFNFLFIIFHFFAVFLKD